MLIAFAYCKVSWKRTTLLTNLIFTRVFNFLASNPTSMQALSHFCRPFPNFLIQVIIFYKACWTSFKDISFMPTQRLASLVAY